MADVRTMRRRYPILLLPMTVSLVGLSMMSQFYRAMMAVIAPDLVAELGLSGKGLSLISASYFVSIAAMQLPAGILVDRFGSRWTLSATLFVAVLGTVVFFLAGSVPGLALGMLLIGLGCSAIFIGSVSVFARWLPPERFAFVFAAWTALSNVGYLVSTVPLAIAVQGLGWRGAVLASGVLFGGLACVAMLSVRDAPPGHAFWSRVPEGSAEMLGGLRKVLSTPAIWHVLALQFIGYSVVATVRGLWAGP